MSSASRNSESLTSTWLVGSQVVLGVGCHTELTPLPSRKKSLAGMKRARADEDSDAEDPGAPPEAEGAGQQEEEEDEAEYFRQAVGEEPDEGTWTESVQLGTMGLSLCPGGPDSLSLQICSPRPNGDGPPDLQARSTG